MLGPEEVAAALHLRANWVETGNVVLSRNDAVRSGRPGLVRALDDGQLELVRELAGGLLSGSARLAGRPGVSGRPG